MRLFKPKNKLDSKSQEIAIMYLCRVKSQLENELETGKRKGEILKWTAEHDIKCLDNAIDYLEK